MCHFPLYTVYRVPQFLFTSSWQELSIWRYHSPATLGRKLISGTLMRNLILRSLPRAHPHRWGFGHRLSSFFTTMDHVSIRITAGLKLPYIISVMMTFVVNWNKWNWHDYIHDIHVESLILHSWFYIQCWKCSLMSLKIKTLKRQASHVAFRPHIPIMDLILTLKTSCFQ